MQKNKKINECRPFVQELERLFINNPVDLPSSPLSADDYFLIVKAAKVITSYHNYTINKDSPEWDYFATKWNALLNFRAEDQLNDYQTYHDVFVAIIENWGKLKHNPYTYRCVASLARMLVDK